MSLKVTLELRESQLIKWQLLAEDLEKLHQALQKTDWCRIPNLLKQVGLIHAELAEDFVALLQGIAPIGAS